MKTVGIALAFGDLYTDHGEGHLILPLDGSTDRLQKLRYNMGRFKLSQIICTAGYSRERPQIPHPKRSVSLAHQMQRFFEETGDVWAERFIARPMCWGTRNEVRLGIKLAIQTGFADKDVPTSLVIASNTAHLPRVWLYTLLYKPTLWRLRLVRVIHHFSLTDTCIAEPIKFLRDSVYICCVLYRMWRRKRHVTTSTKQ